MKNIFLFNFLSILFFASISDVIAGINEELSTKLHISTLQKNNPTNIQKKTKADLEIDRLKKDIQTQPTAENYHALAKAYCSKRLETIYYDPSDHTGHQQKAIDLGIETYKKSIQEFPHASILYCGLGDLYFCINHDSNAAIHILKRGINNCPSSDLYCRLVDVYRYGTKDTKKAIETCKKGLESYYNLNLYLALGEHLSFLSRSRINYKEKIQYKKEAINAYEEALLFDKTDTEYQKTLRSMLILYCELYEIYSKTPDVYSNKIKEYQSKIIELFEKTKQIDDFIINEKIMTTIQTISFALEETEININQQKEPSIPKKIINYNELHLNENNKINETQLHTQDLIISKKMSIENNDPNHSSESDENIIILHKSTEPIESSQTISDNSLSINHSNENNIFWGDSQEPTALIQDTQGITSNDFSLNPHDVLDQFIKDYKKSEYITNLDTLVDDLKLHIDQFDFFRFYNKISNYYNFYFLEYEKNNQKKIEYMEKSLYYYERAYFYGNEKNKSSIGIISKYIYFKLGEIYTFYLNDNKINVNDKLKYMETIFNNYNAAYSFNDIQLNNKINKKFAFIYYTLGNIYNFYFSKHEKNIFQKIQYIEIAINAYNNALRFDTYQDNKNTKENLKKMYLILGHIYNSDLAKAETNGTQKREFQKAAHQAYQNAFDLSTTKDKAKILSKIKYLEQWL